MSDYPLTRALLVELCGLDETDAQLPLAVVLDLHRAQLRAPLIAVAQLQKTDPNGWETELDRRYRGVPFVRFDYGEEEANRLVRAYKVAQRNWGAPSVEGAAVAKAIWHAEDEWTRYAMMLFLYYVADPRSARFEALDVLEYFLERSPATGPMLLDLAA